MNTLISNSSNFDEIVNQLRNERHQWILRLMETTQTALLHIENGSWPIVEQALLDCNNGLCDIRISLQQKLSRRRGQIDNDATQTLSG